MKPTETRVITVVPDTSYNQELEKSIEGLYDKSKILKIADTWNLWYFHGKLNEFIKYDKGRIYNDNLPEKYTKETISWSIIRGDKVLKPKKVSFVLIPYLNGIFPVKVLGYSNECIGFFWTDTERQLIWDKTRFPYHCQKGLIVDANVEEDITYALDIFKNSII